MGAVAAVGVLHTVVPDHWLPITIVARRRGWPKRETARAAAIAGTGHTVSTLLIGLVVWLAGVAFAAKFGNLVSIVSSLALVAFGAWIAISSLFELRAGGHHPHAHAHAHAHADADEQEGDTDHDDHDRDGHANDRDDHGHDHDEKAASIERGRLPSPKRDRTALLLILGSSPMVEGVPAFFAAARFGPALIGVMAVAFAAATIATYVALCVTSLAGLQRVNLGPLERYGEVLSGTFIALVGLIFLAR